ncbi:MAG TPA: efflux RND transporter periplasmic adaptor subunit [Thermoanaerobaculia bacterium]|jgi:HlyD family secretion protein|nr:efflux RND transporter periplasmic adaptor subunit [Thermoanaerobaculia bacterium]
MKKWMWIAVVLAVAVGLFLVVGGRKKSEPKYRTAKVDRGDVTQTVTATGSVAAVTTVAVGSQVSGIISKLYVDFNSQVKKGDLLAELDPTPFQEKVNAARAGLEKAQVEMRNTRIGLERQKALKKEGLAPQADYDAAQANYDSARASVQQAAAAVKQAETDLKYTKIVAPIDGVVVARQYDVGQTVAASFQAPTLFTLAQDLTKMQVAADVSESDIGAVKVGQPVRFNVDAYPDRDFRGRVSQIRLNATVNQNVVTYPVIVEVQNPDLMLRPTMTANVSIEVARARDVLRIPNAALRWKPEVKAGASTEEAAARLGQGGGTAAMARQVDQSRGGGGQGSGRRGRGAARAQQTVYKLPTGKEEPAPVEVKTGISDGRFTQVVEGQIASGDTVVTGLATAKADSTSGAIGGGRGAGGGRRGF